MSGNFYKSFHLQKILWYKYDVGRTWAQFQIIS